MASTTDTAPAIGIDLGTTNSCAAIHDGTRPRVISSNLGYATIPSVLTFDREGGCVVGQQAERQMVLHPASCIYGSKRLLGRACVPGTLERFQPHFAYELVGDAEGFIAARIHDQTVPLVDVAARILRALREAAEAALGKRVERAVITVPAYFHENQRALVRQAGQLAGLEVLQIINEPTAAALSFGAKRDEQKRVLVFDLGGGTFDVSIVELAGGELNVVGVDGDSFLGGLDFDTRLCAIVQQKLATRLGKKELELDTIARARLLAAARSAKHELSGHAQTTIELRCLSLPDGSMVNVQEQVSAAEYEAACAELLSRTHAVIKRALDRSRLRPQDIQEVLLVGGQTRMPAVERQLVEFFGKKPSKRVHPDEAVALGAAIAAYARDGHTPSVVRDMLPMPIGTARADGQFQPLIPRNAALPAEVTVRVTAQPVGTTLHLPLFQGDGSHAFDNEVLGAITFNGVSGKRGPVDLSVTLRLDAEGLLTASARQAGTAQEQTVQLSSNHVPTALLAEVVQSRLEVTVEAPNAKASNAKAQGPAAQGKAASTTKAPTTAKADATGRGPASARKEVEKPGFWQRLMGFFRRT
ncbi:MAG: Hsp70 family protein [Deltaproteobacteria bacterium]|nr:Hsp70 family protein [Deltaproteobacteria bacterium]